MTVYILGTFLAVFAYQKPRTNNMENSSMYDGAQLWNSILKEIRESKSLSCFRNKIAAHIGA